MDSNKSFIKGVERLVNPVEVGAIHFVHGLNRLLPRAIQNKLTEMSGKVTQFMGFVVEPYSLFLAYEITDLEKAKALLPEGYRLIKTRLFADSEPKYYSIFGAFRAHTSAFWGTRMEFYVIAENKKTGLLSWVIIDYDSNTISHDEKHGLRDPNSDSAVVTINHRGRLFVDIENKKEKRALILDANIEAGKQKALEQRLWLEGNLSVGYGKELSNNSDNTFALRFEPCEMEKALMLSLKDVNIEKNTWYSDMIATEPSEVVCFPYAQHFVSDSPGHSSKIVNKRELIDSIKELDIDNISPVKASPFINLVILQTVLVVVLSLALIYLLFI